MKHQFCRIYILTLASVLFSSCASSIVSNPLVTYVNEDATIEIGILDLSIAVRTPLSPYAYGSVFVIDFYEKNLSQETTFFDIFYVSGFRHADGIVTEYDDLFIVDPSSDYFPYLTQPLFCDSSLNVNPIRAKKNITCSYEITISIEQSFNKEGNYTIGFYTQAGPRSSFFNYFNEDTVNHFLLDNRILSIDVYFNENSMVIL